MKNLKILMILPVMAIILAGCPSAVEDVSQFAEPISRPHVAVMVAEGFHDGEAYMTIGYLVNQGMNITIIGPETGTVKAYNSDFTIDIERSAGNASITNYDALVLPGGTAPSVLRDVPEAVEFAKHFFETGKPVAAICHGPQVLVTAGVLEGKTATGVGGIQEEIEDAGAEFIDQPLVIDDNLITSRVPRDLADFSRAIAEAVHKSFEPEVPRSIPPQPGI